MSSRVISVIALYYASTLDLAITFYFLLFAQLTYEYRSGPTVLLSVAIATPDYCSTLHG